MASSQQVFSQERSANADKLQFSNDTFSLKDRVAIISGASRGIGKECALALAREGCHVVVAAKSTTPKPDLPGTIYSVSEQVISEGKRYGHSEIKSLPVQMNVLSEESIKAAVDKAIKMFGKIDIVINNASALWWQDIEDTPTSKFDLINRLNARGTFLLTKFCLPYMKTNLFGRVITMSPPIGTDYKFFRGVTAYNMSKYGMTMVALGVAAEYEDFNVTGNSLWPATVVESQASINFSLGEKRTWRKATILADAVVALITDPAAPTGNMFIDDEYLMSRGLNEKDLVHYRYDPVFDPPRSLAEKAHSSYGGISGAVLKRGDVKVLEKDIAKSKL